MLTIKDDDLNGFFVKIPVGLNFETGNQRSVFVVLVQKASSRDSEVTKGKLKGLLVKRGHTLISRSKLLELNTIGIRALSKALKGLEKNGRIKIHSVRGHYSLFEIINYDTFQGYTNDFKKDFGLEKKLEKALSLGVPLGQLPDDIAFSGRQYEKIREIGLKEINRRWGIPNEKRKLLSELQN